MGKWCLITILSYIVGFGPFSDYSNGDNLMSDNLPDAPLGEFVLFRSEDG